MCKEFLYRIAELHDILQNTMSDIPTFVRRNKEYLEFSNGTQIRIATTTSRLRGHTCNLMIVDEAAFIQDPEDFVYCAIPTYASSKNCQMIFLSTPRGKDNYLNELYTKAYTHQNEFVASRMYTDDIPGREEYVKRCITYLSERDIIRELMGLFWDYDKKFKQRKKK